MSVSLCQDGWHLASLVQVGGGRWGVEGMCVLDEHVPVRLVVVGRYCVKGCWLK